ncbi:MAG: hypothetical protein ABMA14_05775 [Hyphomonadaceae bacterium]
MLELLAVQNPLTLKLALFVGAFLLAAASALVRPALSASLLNSIQDSPGVIHVTGAVTAFAGGGLLVAHTDFSSITAALVTLTAIWWAIEGLGMLAIGHLLKIATPGAIRAYAFSNIPALFIGAFLIIAGFAGHASELTP